MSQNQSVCTSLERVEKEWEKIPVEICTNVIESMPKRIAAVIKAKGGHAKY